MSYQTQKAAGDQLRPHVQRGTTVYTILRYVSASKNTRDISLFIMRDGEPWDITYLFCRLFDLNRHQLNGGIRVRGSGRDMGLELVFTLSRHLFTKENGTPDESALNHKWL